MAVKKVKLERTHGAGIFISKFKIVEITDDKANWWPRQILNFNNNTCTVRLDTEKNYILSWMVRGTAGAKFSVKKSIQSGPKSDAISERKIPDTINGISNRKIAGGFENNGGLRLIIK